MKTVSKNPVRPELYNLVMSNKKTIGENIDTLLAEQGNGKNYYGVIKYVLLQAVIQEVLNPRIMLYEFFNLETFWQEIPQPKYPLMLIPETGKQATQK